MKLEELSKKADEIEKNLNGLSGRFRRIGNFFYVSAIENVPGYNVNATWGSHPIIRLEDREDIPTILKNKNYRSNVILFYGFGSPLGYDDEPLAFGHSPSTDAGLMALQKLELEGEYVLDAGCRIGEHSIQPAKMGARVLGVSREVIGTKINVRLNEVRDRVQLVAGDLTSYKPSFFKNISVVITNGGPVIELAERAENARVFIDCENDTEYLRSVGYTNFEKVTAPTDS